MSIIDKHLKVIAQTDLKHELAKVFAAIESAHGYADRLVDYLKPLSMDIAGMVAVGRNYLESALDYAVPMYSQAQKESVPSDVENMKRVLEGLRKTNAMLKDSRDGLTAFKNKTINQTHLAIVDKVIDKLNKAEAQFMGALGRLSK